MVCELDAQPAKQTAASNGRGLKANMATLFSYVQSGGHGRAAGQQAAWQRNRKIRRAV
jgi:hypothetical protein